DWAYRPGWVTDPVRTGGVFNVWGVHVLDLICDLAGAAPKQVFAIGGSYRLTDTPYPDGAQIVIDFGAVKASLVYCRFAESFRRDWAEVTVAGDKGRLEGFIAKREMIFTPVDGPPETPVHGEPFESFCFDGCRQQLVDFLTAIEKRKQPTVTVQDGLRATQLALAIEKSLATGKLVKP
ncbi:MAG TPA: Gfo/Idh/MocA family oxidoreductase, partial [Planctomycetota bacterium]|nr:Gfo/Idh/MocA family oxidoreductase [Planctomycetota bacterium]